jgi:hypothetical protein
LAGESVVLGGVQDEVAQELAGVFVDDADVAVLDAEPADAPSTVKTEPARPRSARRPPRRRRTWAVDIAPPRDHNLLVTSQRKRHSPAQRDPERVPTGTGPWSTMAARVAPAEPVEEVGKKVMTEIKGGAAEQKSIKRPHRRHAQGASGSRSPIGTVVMPDRNGPEAP